MRPNLVAAAVVACLTALAGRASAAPAACTLDALAGLPVMMEGLNPTVSVQIDHAPAKLLIDTGSSWSVLNTAAAARLRLYVQSAFGLDVAGMTGLSGVGVTRAGALDLSGYVEHNARFLVAEHDISEATDGALGQNLMDAADAEFDLANGEVRLVRPKNCGDGVQLAYWTHDQVPFIGLEPTTDDSRTIVGSATLNGVRIRVMFDTGTSRSIVTSSAARRAGVRTDAPGVTPAGQASGVGRRLINVWLAPFDSFEIGGERVQNTRLRVADFTASGVDMILGADFFLSHRIYVARSQNRLYFTFNGGPVFDLERFQPAASVVPATPAPAPPSAAAGEPTLAALAANTPKDASGFVRRGNAFMARLMYAQAVADFGSAIQLAPTIGALYADRGAAYLRGGQSAPAQADFDQALKLSPGLALALLGRGELRLQAKDAEGAKADFAALLKDGPQFAYDIGNVYLEAKLYAEAAAQFDAWLAGKPKNEDTEPALFARCQARAMGGLDLDKALDDCNTAMRLRPGGAGYPEMRGLILLRQGKLGDALTAFNAALRQQSRDAFALYGRGLVELRQGMKDKGEADIASASALDPTIAVQMTAFGLAR